MSVFDTNTCKIIEDSPWKSLIQYWIVHLIWFSVHGICIESFFFSIKSTSHLLYDSLSHETLPHVHPPTPLVAFSPHDFTPTLLSKTRLAHAQCRQKHSRDARLEKFRRVSFFLLHIVNNIRWLKTRKLPMRNIFSCCVTLIVQSGTQSDLIQHAHGRKWHQGVKNGAI